MYFVSISFIPHMALIKDILVLLVVLLLILLNVVFHLRNGIADLTKI